MPPLGAMASGWNPGAPLSDNDLAALRHALADPSAPTPTVGNKATW